MLVEALYSRKPRFFGKEQTGKWEIPFEEGGCGETFPSPLGEIALFSAFGRFLGVSGLRKRSLQVFDGTGQEIQGPRKAVYFLQKSAPKNEIVFVDGRERLTLRVINDPV